MTISVRPGAYGRPAGWMFGILMLAATGAMLLSIATMGGCEAKSTDLSTGQQGKASTTQPVDIMRIWTGASLALGGAGLILSIVALSIASSASKAAKAVAARPVPTSLTIDDILRSPQFQQNLMAAVRAGVVDEQARLMMSLQTAQTSSASSAQAGAAAKPVEQPQGPAPISRKELKAVIRAVTDLLESSDELSTGADGPSFAMSALMAKLPQDMGNTQERWCYIIAQLNTALKDSPYPVLASPFIQMEQARSWDGKPNVRFTVKANAIAALCRIAAKFDAKEQNNA